MNSSTSALLANITDMQSRLLEMQQQLASQLQREKRVGAAVRGRVPYSYHRVDHSVGAASNTSIRLQHAHSLSGSDQHQTHSSRPSRLPRQSTQRPLPHPNKYQDRRQNRYVKQEEKKETETTYEPIALSSVLNPNEEVVMRVILKKDDEGQPIYTTTTAVFNGDVLTVVASELAPQLVGVESAKPGAILYQFIDALKEGGHLKRSFTIAPWKLCVVSRDGQLVTLEDLRRAYLASSKSE